MLKESRKVFVTGASGKIGKKLVIQLLNCGHRVTALVRNETGLSQNSKLKIIKADLLDLNKYKRDLITSDYVYHLAVYQNLFDANIDEFFRINVKGTKTILNALIKSQVIKFIYVSTVMVFNPTDKKKRDEKWSKRSSGKKNYYVTTKLQALKILEEYKSKIPMITLYPTIVIDTNEIKNTKKIPGSIMCMIGNKNRIGNYIFLENLIKVMVNVLKKGEVGEDYILGGGNITAENYLREIARISHRIFLPFRIPLAFIKLASRFPVPGQKLFNFIADNPPEDMCFSSQKAIRHLKLEIKELKDL